MTTVRGPIRRYYIPYEVASHSSPEDIWISFLGGVYDITPLVAENSGVLVAPMLSAAGTDISHWFDPKTRDVKTHMDPITNLEQPYLPMGRFLHTAPVEPVCNWDTSFGKPWWKDTKYLIGNLSVKPRVVRVKNVLTGQDDQLEVPSEEAVVEIRERYLELNWHARSYTWKALITVDGVSEFKELDLNLTLEDNGVMDESESFDDHQIGQEVYVPVLAVYWNDDLTVA
ncbi:MAG: hypothetical protein WDW38_009712 [Sanguina aurantia]